MATALATKPAPLHQKMKRPPPPVQTSVNGVRSSHSSPSPSISSKRPSGFKHPPNATAINGANGNVNGGVQRSSNRRRDSQKPGDTQGRPIKVNKNGQVEGIFDRKNQKKKPEPYIKDTAFILKKYRNAAPSLILHIHATQFRFEQQDGSFSYNSPMRSILEHIKLSTVPHDLLEEFAAAGVKFYEGCLIVQIQDHRSTSNSSASTNVPVADKHVPFSIHNHNDYLIPSPYVPYPQPKPSEGKGKETNNVSAAGGSSIEAAKKGDVHESAEAQAPKEPKIFTTVLFSTPLSLNEEVLIYANTPDPRPNSRKQSQSSLSRTPASATLPQPPTPLSAMPPTPSTAGPLAKRQKMLIGEKDIADFESKAIASTAAPLFLEPATSFEHAQTILERLSDPLHQGDPPPPKARKRTVAELAADEALAASEQRFMLIMDERLAPSISATAGKSASSDTEAGALFEPRFERFKTLEAIKANHRERAQRESEQKAAQHTQQAANKAKQERLEQEAQRQAQDQKQVESTRREQEHRKMLALQQQQAQHAQQQVQHAQQQAQHQAQQQAQQSQPQQPPQQAQHQRQQTPQQQPPRPPSQPQLKHPQHQHQHSSANQNQPSHSNSTNGVLSNLPQSMVPASQAHQSPIVRDGTPHSHSSPPVGTSMGSHPNQSVAMALSSSNQGNASSPPRPSSAVQHGHPGGGVPMVHQRSQQPPSRRGTPQVGIGTPNLQQVTPVNQATPTSRMGHASPPNTIAHTPGMGQNPIATQHLAGTMAQMAHQRTLQMQNQYLQNQQRAFIQQQQQHQQQQHQQQQQQQQQQLQKQQQQQQQQQHPHQHQLHNSPPNIQMSSDRPQIMNSQMQREYNQSLHNHHQQMNGQQINGHTANGAPTMQHPSNGQLHMQPHPQQRAIPGMPTPAQVQQLQHKCLNGFIKRLQHQHGGSAIPEQAVAAARQQATEMANSWAQSLRQQAQQQSQTQGQTAQAHARQQMMANNGHLSNGGMN
ncbi:Transcription factor spt20, partial [Pseudocyphellaria aurata]|nr:Transcription factor spt20 [Pseudocyphellaria aurata]